MTQDTRPAPYPANTRAKGWRFEYDMEAFEASDTWLRARNGMVRGALLMLHTRAWGQTPCGSLPNDDELISLLIDMEPEDFAKHKAVLLRDWYCAEDGRLYHPMLTVRVLDMMDKRRSEADRKARSRAAKAASKVCDEGAGPAPAAPEPAQMSHGTTTGLPQESDSSPESVHRESDTRTRTRTSNTKEHAYACLPTTALPTDGGRPPPPDDGPGEPSRAAPPPKPGPGIPPCPYDALIDAYERCCPTMPQVRRQLFRAGKRAEVMRARWKWVMTEMQEVGENAGQRMATTEEEGVAWFGKYFARVAESDFLTGRNGVWTGCDLEFLMTQSKFAGVLEGKYHREAAHA